MSRACSGRSSGTSRSAAPAGPGFQVLQPPGRVAGEAPGGWDFPGTRVYYDTSEARSEDAAKEVAKLFGEAWIGPMTPRLLPYANGAMLVVVVGKPFSGS